MYTRDTELRRLQSNDVNRLAETLGLDGGRKLMEIIPKYWINPDATAAQGTHKLNGDIKSSCVVELKYRPEQIRLIEEATRQTSGCYFAEILIQEWSTSGRKHERPTVGLLLQLLIKADLWNAADFVAEHFLNESVPERPLEGPGAKVDISIPTVCLGSVADFVNDSMGYPDTEALNENANCLNSLGDHNRDYYMKFSHFSKDINGTPPKPPPRAQRAARQQNCINQQQQQSLKNQQLQLSRKQINNDDGKVETNENNRSRQESREILQTSKQQEQNFDTSVSSTMTAHNIPELSDLLEVNSSQHSRMKSEDTPMLSLIDANTSTTKSAAVYSNASVVASSSSSVVPKPPSTSILCSDSLPLLTELNLDNVTSEMANNGCRTSHNSHQQQISSTSPNHSSDGSGCSSLSNDSFEDDNDGYNGRNVYNGVNMSDAGNVDIDEFVDGHSGENSLPYLSVFGRQSPNNDSSLTTVTCTSGDNSFELSLNDSSSTSTTDPTAQRK